MRCRAEERETTLPGVQRVLIEMLCVRTKGLQTLALEQ